MARVATAPRQRADILGAALAALLLAINAAGAIAGFPVMDDGELMTTSREAGVASIGPSNRDRPINGWLIHESVRLLGERPALWAIIAAAFWAILAWQTARLVRRLLPGRPASAGVAPLLVIAPLVVQLQYTTLTFVFAACLPVALCLEGLLIVLTPNENQEPDVKRLVAAALLVGVGALVSEYAIATMTAGAALLLVLGRRRDATFFGIGGILGYAAFRTIADAAARPDTMPVAALAQLPGSLGTLTARWMSGAWQSLVGAYGMAAGSLKIDPSSKTTLAAILVGALCAGVVTLASRRAPDVAPGSPRVLAGLLVAVLAGLLPFVVAGRDPGSDWFASRFRLPILPFAIAATTHILDRIAAAHWRFIPRAALAFLAGYAVVGGASEVRRSQQTYDEIGRLLLPIAHSSEGLTVVVIPDLKYSIGWAKLMYRWPLEDERRGWALTEEAALGTFGSREACRGTSQFRVRQSLRNVGRDGPLARLLWARRTGNSFVLEPYCAPPEH